MVGAAASRCCSRHSILAGAACGVRLQQAGSVAGSRCTVTCSQSGYCLLGSRFSSAVSTQEPHQSMLNPPTHPPTHLA